MKTNREVLKAGRQLACYNFMRKRNTQVWIATAFLFLGVSLLNAQVKHEYLVIDLNFGIYTSNDYRIKIAETKIPKEYGIMIRDFKVNSSSFCPVSELNYSATLNFLGDLGWELVTIRPIKDKMLAFFKRESIKK